MMDARTNLLARYRMALEAITSLHSHTNDMDIVKAIADKALENK